MMPYATRNLGFYKAGLYRNNNYNKNQIVENKRKSSKMESNKKEWRIFQNLSNERFENEKYFSTIKANSFLIKISKPKCITYFDKYQNKKQVFSPHYFSYKFVRLDRVSN